MWVIISRYKNEPRDKFGGSWISGVFKDRQDAQEYLSVNLNDISDVSSDLQEIPTKDYPIFFILDFENYNFTYVTQEQLAERLLSFEKIEDEDHVYCNYYIFREDYRSIVPGSDYLGWTDHHHVDKGAIKRLLWRALKIQSVGNYDGIYACSNCDKLGKGILSIKGYAPPQNWHIIPWAEANDVEDESYLINDGESVPETHTATYFIACSENCRTSLITC